MNGLPLFRSVETAAAITDSVLVAFSGGKDSVVTLDVCMKHFAHVEGFFMYQVRGLSFQESILRYYEDKYGIPIHRIPHFELSQWLRYGLFRPCDFDCPIVSVKETYDYMRENTDIWWIAAGERIADSVWRRAMLTSSPAQSRGIPSGGNLAIASLSGFLLPRDCPEEQGLVFAANIPTWGILRVRTNRLFPQVSLSLHRLTRHALPPCHLVAYKRQKGKNSS